MTIDTHIVGRRNFVLGAGASFLLSGCSIGEELGQVIGPPPAPQIYTLDPQLPAAAQAARVPWQLAVTIPEAPASYDTVRIALKPTPLTLDFYADAAWQDRAPILIQGLLLRAFEQTGRVAAARDSEGVLANYVLRTEIRALEAQYIGGLATGPDMPSAPPRISVGLNARLIAVPQREIAGFISVEHSADATSNDMNSIVSAFNQALGAALAEIVTWTLATPSAA